MLVRPFTLPGLVPRVALVLLASRLSRQAGEEDLMTCGPRRAIKELVDREPGIPLSEIMDRLSLGSGSMYHHLRVLTDAGLVRTTVVGRRRHVYPGALPRDEVRTIRNVSILRGRTAMDVARAVSEAPGCSASSLGRRLGLSLRVVYYHVKRLEDAGLLRCEPGKGYRHLEATPALLEHLDEGVEVDPVDAPRLTAT